ncbi:MAG: hypothetical protein H6682_19630 [Candidatus Eisenbacteria bacterium]|nr:hypothetical protein [Candidatus Eisenbacteria bacterium]
MLFLFALAGASMAVPNCSEIECFSDGDCHGGHVVWVTLCGSGIATFYCAWSDCAPSETMACDCSLGGGHSCFLAGTQIQMADGSTKAIEDIAVGDVLEGYDASTSAAVPSRVEVVVAPREVDSYFVINRKIYATGTQPVLSKGDWVDVASLQAGDTLTDSDGNAVPIRSIEEVFQKVTVYNMNVSSSTYIADGIVAHNKNFYTIYSPDEGQGP